MCVRICTYHACTYVHMYVDPLQPEDLTVLEDKITETTITLSWKKPKPSDVPDPSDTLITGYEVEYRKSSEQFKKLENSLTHEDLTCEVTGLVAHTEYQFRVAAINAAGHGPFTDVVTQFTSESSVVYFYLYVHTYVHMYVHNPRVKQNIQSNKSYSYCFLIYYIYDTCYLLFCSYQDF